MNEQLEPCPFCGTRAQLYREMELWKVVCTNAICPAFVTLGFDAEADAIAAWNKRTSTELIADYKRLQFDVVNLLFRDKFAAQIIEPLALEGNPRARFWMAGFGLKKTVDEPSTHADAMQTINTLSIELARLCTELAAKSPPPAVPSYHRLDFSERRPCFRCTQPMDDIYLTAFGQEDLCKKCAEELGAEVFFPQEG